MYTKEELIARKENFLYHQQHGITDADVDKVNKLVADLEARLKDGKRPEIRPGDAMTLYGFNNHENKEVVYDNARCSKFNNDVLTYCAKPYVPFIYPDLSMPSLSGGYFGGIDQSRLKYLGKKKVEFVVWGYYGACANGGVYFEATVNHWEYVDRNNIY